MLIHCGSSEQIESMFYENKNLLINLCFSSYAEIISNCSMFGGKDSISFKIKHKKLVQRIKQINKLIKEEK